MGFDISAAGSRGDALKRVRMNGDEESPDPRERGPLPSQDVDPASGTSDDPRVDPTPDHRHTDDADGGTRDL